MMRWIASSLPTESTVVVHARELVTLPGQPVQAATGALDQTTRRVLFTSTRAHLASRRRELPTALLLQDLAKFVNKTTTVKEQTIPKRPAQRDISVLLAPNLRLSSHVPPARSEKR